MEKLPEDHILCCLLPSRCNLFDQSVTVLVINSIFYSLNSLVIVLILATTNYLIWLIWKQFTKEILIDIVRKNHSKDSIYACEREVKLMNDISEKGDMFDTLLHNYDSNYKGCKQTNNKKSLKYKCNVNTNTKPEYETRKCSKLNDKDTNKNISEVCANQKEKDDRMQSKTRSCINKNKWSTQKIKKDCFCITTYTKYHSSIFNDKLIIPDSCWPLVKKIYRRCK